MRNTLDDALRAVFSVEAVPPSKIKKALSGMPAGPLADMAQKALGHYNNTLEYLKGADWTKYGQELNKIKDILQRMTHKK